jgi:hypothetical protein
VGRLTGRWRARAPHWCRAWGFAAVVLLYVAFRLALTSSRQFL